MKKYKSSLDDDEAEKERYVDDCIASVMPRDWDSKISDLANELGISWLLNIPGVWELVSEELQNSVHGYFENKFAEQYEDEK